MDDQRKTETYHLSPDEIAQMLTRGPCVRCGAQVSFPGAKTCGACWSLETQIPTHPDIAAQILRECGYTVTKSVYYSIKGVR